jgi:hypothetical protein
VARRSGTVRLGFLRHSFRSQLPWAPKTRVVHLQFPAEQSAFEARDVVLDTITGYVFDAERRLVAESTSWEAGHAINRMPERPIFPLRVRTNQTLCFLGSEAYYHWLIEDLPAYLRAKNAFSDSITGIRTASPPYVFDVLALLGEKSLTLPLYAKVRSLGMSKKSRALEPRSEDIALLEEFRDKFRKNDGDNGVRRTAAKIYLSRRESGRYPANEDAVEELMLTSGFDIVHLAGMSFLDQINLFYAATEIIGTHGAGLANLAWAQRSSTRVIEIARDSQPDCFERIALIKELKYNRINSPDTGEWVVDVAALSKTINASAGN